ncbi:hypothetical protein OAE79_02530 [Rhodopirellula sp.]|nr:hypothetical protein [Rhodopirellula sp.]MDB4679193.1 hypothetical protein [Rhodopirellula sp.]
MSKSKASKQETKQVHGLPDQEAIMPNWYEKTVIRSIMRSLLVVVPTYILAAVGLSFNQNVESIQAGNETIPPLIGTLFCLLFTLTHGVIPVFFYSIFTGITTGTDKDSSNELNPVAMCISGFVYLHMGLWYGAPIIGLATVTGWLNVAWVVLHILLAGKGNRRWAFLEHGSTSMALGLFIVCFSGANLVPLGLTVVVLQAFLLTLVEWKGKGLWVA